MFVGARPSSLTATPGAPAARAALAGPLRIGPTDCDSSPMVLQDWVRAWVGDRVRVTVEGSGSGFDWSEGQGRARVGRGYS